MGICGTKEQNVAPQRIRQLQVLANDDVNLQYSIMFKILDNEVTGTGIKRTKAYISTVPEGKLLKLRNEFWETRTEGRPEGWGMIRNAIEADEETGRMILQAGDMELEGKNLERVYERLGYLYEIPIFCINDPKEYRVPQEAPQAVQGDIPLRIRCNRFSEDFEVKINAAQDVGQLKSIILQSQKLHQIRLFYRGKEMLDQNPVGMYVSQQGGIVIGSGF